jgi:hypothetical protein
MVSEASGKGDSLFYLLAGVVGLWGLSWITYLLIITH